MEGIEFHTGAAIGHEIDDLAPFDFDAFEFRDIAGARAARLLQTGLNVDVAVEFDAEREVVRERCEIAAIHSLVMLQRRVFHGVARPT